MDKQVSADIKGEENKAHIRKENEMDYKIIIPTNATITIAFNHKESIAVLNMIGKTSIAQRIHDIGMTKEDAQICSDIFFTVSLEDKLKLGLC